MRFLHRLAVGLLIPTLLQGGSTLADEPPAKMRLLVPAYFYPSREGVKDWEKLLQAPEAAGVVAIVNPASGPGRRVDPNYTKIFDQAKKSKVTLIGYVSTSYGKRPSEEVLADVDKWVSFYPDIQGIFFDEQANGTEQLEKLAALYEHVHKKQKLSLVITNPGTICDKQYLTRPAADAACLYEGFERWDRFTPPEWTKELKPDRIAALLYKVDSAGEMQKHIRQAKERRLGWIYVTDDSGNNPWDRLPSYWDEEVKAIQELNSE